MCCIFCNYHHQVSTRVQSTTMPLWNEILEVPVASLPCCGTLSLEVTTATEQIFENTCFGASFGFILTDSLELGFSDDWLSMNASSTSFMSDSSDDLTTLDLSSLIYQPKLHISCSFNRNMVLARQKGMWPSHLVDPPRLDHSTNIKVSELMPKSSLIYRPRLRQYSRPGSFKSSPDQDSPRACSPEMQGSDQQAQRRRFSPERRLSEQMRSSSTPCAGMGRRYSVFLLGGQDDCADLAVKDTDASGA
jgi:hypothetical protein